MSNYSNPRAPLDMGLLRDILAVALLLMGLSGLAWMAFAFDWRAGVAVLSTYAIGAGAYLGYQR